ncbi:MAG: alpha/beta hydrolase [Bacteroidota bacterium]
MYKSLFLIFVFFHSSIFVLSKNKPVVYFFSGQGSDYRLFDSLKIDSGFVKKFIRYTVPGEHANIKEYAVSIINQIDTTSEFYLIGVSFGGMICCELSEIIKPKKTIIISSAKNRNELPGRYKFMKMFPVYKLFFPQLLKIGSRVVQPIVEPDRNKNKRTFVAMLKDKNKFFLKRSIGMIISWDREVNNRKIYHIHGDNDHTLPIKKVKADFTVANGSHMMTLTSANEISLIINKLLLGN